MAAGRGPAADSPDLSVILVSYNTASLLETCLARLERAGQRLRMQVLVVDNASRDDSVAQLRRGWPQFELVANAANVGFARANNQVLDRVRGRYVLLLNVDAFVADDTLDKTLAFMDAQPRCGVLGVRLVGSDGVLQPSCRYFPTPWNGFLQRTGLARLSPRTRLVDEMDWAHDEIRRCDWVPGCFYLVRAEVVRTVGLFDPRFFVYYEEVDHCRRVKAAGWEVVYFPDTSVVHIGGEAAKSEGVLAAGRQLAPLQIESELLYVRKHHGLSGVLALIALTALADALSFAKALLRRNDGVSPGAVAAAGWRHVAAHLESFRRTGWARRPTR